jgi:hypothetical protein
MTDPREQTLVEFHQDRWLAHSVLFSHRHHDSSAPMHKEIIADIYNPDARFSLEGFRGLGKSTLLEEAAIVRAAFREFHNMVIVGASHTRACERLAAVKHEIEYNDNLGMVFGALKGTTWRDDKIVLSNGLCIQALGRDQAMTGLKHLDYRPDSALVDDVEDPEEVRTDAEREQTWVWFIKTFLPALDHPLFSWVRVLGTRRGSGSLPERLENSGWRVRKFPIEHLDGDGNRTATWPAKFPIPVIDRMKQTYKGDMHTWMQEYMCTASSEADRVFTRDSFRVEDVTRTWQATYAMIDPARTTSRQSATTGWAVWSWMQNRLIVWAAGAELLKPDEIIDLTFTIAQEYNPIWIGVEEDGLNEFILQPLRHEQARRQVTIPVRAMRAPKGKHDFIRGLQPFFSAREVIFASPLPELEEQLLSFPTGKIDAPNALAYALTMRPASPIYDSFTQDHISDIDPIAQRPLYLAANATRSSVSAILVQQVDGQLRVYADWILEGSPAEAVARIYAEASLEGDTARMVERPAKRDWSEALKLPNTRHELSRQPIRWVVPPHHRDQWNNVGLLQAIQRIPSQAACGAPEVSGRELLRSGLSKLSRGQPAVVVSERAQWTLRAFTGGYSRSLVKGGGLADHADDGPYRVLMEGLESFAGMISHPKEEDEDDTTGVGWSRDKHGNLYRSAMPARG